MTYLYGMAQVVLSNSVLGTMGSIPPASRVTPSPLILRGHGAMQLYVKPQISRARRAAHDIPQAICPRSARGLLPYEILEIVERELSLPRFATECTPAYISTIRSFLNDHVAHRLAIVRKSRGMFEALERSDEWDEFTDLSMGATGD